MASRRLVLRLAEDASHKVRRNVLLAQHQNCAWRQYSKNRKIMTSARTIGLLMQDPQNKREQDVVSMLGTLTASSILHRQPLQHGNSTSSQSTQRTFSADSAADLPPHQVLTMPSLSPTMTQGNLLEWKKEEGDQVVAGDVICVIETDKATLDNEAQEEGFLAKILVSAGSKDVPVSQPIAIIADSKEDLARFANYSAHSSAVTASAASEVSSLASSSAHPLPPLQSGPLPTHLGPSVKILLEQSKIDPRTIRGSGPNGIILKGDVLAAIASSPSPSPPSAPDPSLPPPRAPLSSAPSAPTVASSPVKPPPALSPPSPLPAKPSAGRAPRGGGDFVDIPTTQIRRIIAQRLMESRWGSPHMYAEAEAIIDATLALRKEMKEKFKVAVSVNDFVIKAVAMALREVEQANVYWDAKSKSIVQNSVVDISIAVATDKGLITPIVRDADKKSLSQISAEVKSLAEKARSGKLQPHEFQGGTFCISNLGMFSVDRFCAIINPPQSGILAVGRGSQTPIWSHEENGPLIATKMEVTLSGDARVVGGDVAGQLLNSISLNLSEPRRLML